MENFRPYVLGCSAYPNILETITSYIIFYSLYVSIAIDKRIFCECPKLLCVLCKNQCRRAIELTWDFRSVHTHYNNGSYSVPTILNQILSVKKVMKQEMVMLDSTSLVLDTGLLKWELPGIACSLTACPNLENLAVVMVRQSMFNVRKGIMLDLLHYIWLVTSFDLY